MSALYLFRVGCVRRDGSDTRLPAIHVVTTTAEDAARMGLFLALQRHSHEGREISVMSVDRNESVDAIAPEARP